MSKPIIGIVEWPYTDADGDKIYEVLTPVINSVSKSGGLPIGIFPTQAINYTDFQMKDISLLSKNNIEDLIATLKVCDAIIKPGATRIYEYERFIYSYARENDIPFLGICAGMQMISHYGKEFIKNERNDINSSITHCSKEEYAHSVEIVKDTLLYKIVGQSEIMVNSRHSFHIPDAGLNKISALAPDGIIEAVENPNGLFQLGLQWHPELLPDDKNSQKVFDAVIDAAYVYKKENKKMNSIHLFIFFIL